MIHLIKFLCAFAAVAALCVAVIYVDGRFASWLANAAVIIIGSGVVFVALYFCYPKRASDIISGVVAGITAGLS